MGNGEIACYFSLSVSKELYCRNVKAKACLGKGYTNTDESMQRTTNK